MSDARWPKATRDRPCPKCGKWNRCLIAPDSLAGICWRSGSSEVWRDTPANGNGYASSYVGAAHRPKPNGVVYATAEAAIDLAGRKIDRGTLANVWTYPGDVMRVGRWDLADGTKQFRPVHRIAAGWKIGDPPGPLPLYRSDELSADGPIYVVEGEKCAHCAWSIGLPTVTGAHGSNAAAKSDWTPLAGRDVVILPDHDEPGRRYAADVAAILSDLGCDVKIVALPGVPDGGDIADYIDARDSMENADIAASIVSLAAQTPAVTTDAPALVTAAALVESGPEMSEPVVDGVFRIGEIVNIISGSKSYKTYFLLALLLCIAAGRTWLGFTTRRVRVLLLDNELHPGVLRHRIRAVASALAIDLAEVGDYFHVLSLRGQLRDIRQMGAFFAGLKPGYYGVVALDSWYRMLPAGVDENSNSEMTQLYNLLDFYAAMLKSAIVLIHHSTKGRQGDRQITDVGAGAGAQSRAADCHIILRAHKLDECAVLQSALRSFKPMEATGLRWMYPVWTLASDIDVAELQRDRPNRSGATKPAKEPPKTWTPQEFVVAAVADDPKPKELILAVAVGAGMKDRDARRLLVLAEDQRLVFRHDKRGTGDNKAYFSTREPTVFDSAGGGVSLSRTPPRTPRVRERTGGRAKMRETETGRK